MTFLIMLHSTRTGKFYGGIVSIVMLDFGPRKKYPPALLCASCSDMYDVSKYMWRIIPLLLYSVNGTELHGGGTDIDKTNNRNRKTNHSFFITDQHIQTQ